MSSGSDPVTIRSGVAFKTVWSEIGYTFNRRVEIGCCLVWKRLLMPTLCFYSLLEMSALINF